MKVTKLIALIINLLVVFSFLSAQAGIDEHTVGIWLFDEGTGNKVKDLMDNGNHGDFQGKVKWVDGKFSKALEFKGEGGSVMVPNSKSLDIKKCNNGMDEIDSLKFLYDKMEKTDNNKEFFASMNA